jgi:hypothetical protein
MLCLSKVLLIYLGTRCTELCWLLSGSSSAKSNELFNFKGDGPAEAGVVKSTFQEPDMRLTLLDARLYSKKFLFERNTPSMGNIRRFTRHLLFVQDHTVF